jgi:hypothetical protein
VKQFFNGVLQHWHHDWCFNRRLFWVELFGTVVSMIAAAVTAITVPNCPHLVLYILWLSGSLALTWTSYRRGSSFLLCLMGFYTAMNAVGLFNLIS